MMTGREYLFQIVQNDGNGDQCGESYKQRCEFALLGNGRATRWLQMAVRANQWIRLKEDGASCSMVEELRAAADIAEYYIAHVK